MSMGNVTELDIIKLIFQKTLPSNLGTLNTTGDTNLHIHLHTADPTESGIPSSFEATYTNYTVQSVIRTSGGWTCATAGDITTAKNFAVISFPQCGASVSNVITHVSISDEADTKILYSGQLNDSLNVSNLILPQFQATNLVVTQD